MSVEFARMVPAAPRRSRCRLPLGWRSALLGLTVLALFSPAARAAPQLVQISPTVYQTEHCLFVIDASVTWASPATAYNDLYGFPFARLSSAYDSLVAQFPGTYFSVCYLANTGDSHVPNYIDRTAKASGINETSAAGTPNTFATTDICRYNLPGGAVLKSTLGVFDHELGHAWGARAFYNTAPYPSLSDGHWFANSTVDCQMSSSYSADGYLSVNKLYGDPVNGFHWQKVDNLRSNDYQTFSEQTLYLMGLRKTWPTSYVLNGVVYNPDTTAGFTSVDTLAHADMVAAYGVRTPDYTTEQKRLKVGFVYIARDAAEVNTVYANVEQSVDQFCNAEAFDTHAYRFQAPFLCDTKFRASVDGLLADLDGNASPTLAVTDPYVQSADGNAVVNFVTADPDGPAPVVSVVPASTCAMVAGSTVQLAGLPDGVHFFTLKAVDAGGKRTFGHFVVEVQRPATATAITGQPADQTVVGGNPASFAVTATETPAVFTYQWFRRAVGQSTWNALSDAGAYAGSATATLAVASVPAMSGDEFLCVLSNATGTATSNPALLTVNETVPALTTQPASRLANAGNSAPFSVVAGGPATTFGYFYYLWQRLPVGSGTWIDLTNGGAFTGTSTAALGIVSSLAMNGDQFRCVVSNTAGAVTSNVATLTVGTAPAITTQPVSPLTVPAGQTAAFTIVATGTAPLTYQWSRFGVPVAGATGATLTLPNAQAADAGAYTVAITNAFGSAGSNVGSLTVTAAGPSFTAQPQAAGATVGQNALFSVQVTGSTPFTYQWKRNGVSLAGATGSSLALTNVQFASAGTYTVVVTNSTSSATSAGAVLTVTAVPTSVPRTADFDGDARTELLWRNTVSAQVSSWTIAGGYLNFGPESGGWQVFAAGDFDGDGRAEPLWRNSVSGQVACWTMAGSFLGFGLESGGWQVFAVGDFDGDGKAEPLWRNSVSTQISTWTMAGGYLNFGAESGGWQVIRVGDFDGDGRSEPLWRNTGSTQIACWTMAGGLLPFGPESGGWQVIDAGDFDGDGRSEPLWRNSVSTQIACWTMAGGFLNFGPESGGWQVIGLGDYDGDGRVEPLWRNSVSNQVSTWTMAGGYLNFGPESGGWQVVRY